MGFVVASWIKRGLSMTSAVRSASK